MIFALIMVLWLITQHLYQDVPLWRVPEIDPWIDFSQASSLRERGLDAHKARDDVDQLVAAGR